MNTAITKTNDLGERLDTLAIAAQDAFGTQGNFARTIATGIALAELRSALDDKVMKSLVKLKNTPLGFRTDEGPKVPPYPIEVVRDCIIEAAVRGLQCMGNQFNILAGRMYVTKEGFTYLLRNLPGLSNLRVVPHPAAVTESSTSGTNRAGEQYQKIEREALAKVDISCEYKGKKIKEQREFVIRVNNGMSQDAILGKAERKARAWLYNYLTDQALGDGDAAEAAPVVIEAEPVRPERQNGPSFLDEVGDDQLPGLEPAAPTMSMEPDYEAEFGQLV